MSPFKFGRAYTSSFQVITVWSILNHFKFSCYQMSVIQGLSFTCHLITKIPQHCWTSQPCVFQVNAATIKWLVVLPFRSKRALLANTLLEIKKVSSKLLFATLKVLSVQQVHLEAFRIRLNKRISSSLILLLSKSLCRRYRFRYLIASWFLFTESSFTSIQFKVQRQSRRPSVIFWLNVSLPKGVQYKPSLFACQIQVRL